MRGHNEMFIIGSSSRGKRQGETGKFALQGQGETGLRETSFKINCNKDNEA